MQQSHITLNVWPLRLRSQTTVHLVDLLCTLPTNKLFYRYKAKLLWTLFHIWSQQAVKAELWRKTHWSEYNTSYTRHQVRLATDSQPYTRTLTTHERPVAAIRTILPRRRWGTWTVMPRRRWGSATGTIMPRRRWSPPTSYRRLRRRRDYDIGSDIQRVISTQRFWLVANHRKRKYISWSPRWRRQRVIDRRRESLGGAQTAERRAARVQGWVGVRWGRRWRWAQRWLPLKFTSAWQQQQQQLQQSYNNNCQTITEKMLIRKLRLQHYYFVVNGVYTDFSFFAISIILLSSTPSAQ